MANVYLPYGYPAVQGMEFENVIYQGTMCRLYVGINDPRTNAQLVQRRVNSDMAKMRATMGTFGRAAAVKAMGSQWTRILFQAIKANLDSWWTDAGDMWGNFTDLAKDAWRNAAPYKATFNDAGMIYFMVCRVIAKALRKFGGTGWGTLEWGEGDAAACLAWWQLVAKSFAIKPDGNISGSRIQWVGDWVVDRNYMEGQGSAGDYYEYFFYGRRTIIVAGADRRTNNLSVYIDGQLWETWNQAVEVQKDYRSFKPPKLISVRVVKDAAFCECATPIYIEY